ncbi:MAG: MauE/DoxX family redox-associated membrane protein [Pseudomonadota bacterium]
MDPALGTLIDAANALLLGQAALHKLRSPARFAATFEAYRILPRLFARVAGYVVPSLELAVALALLLPMTRTTAAAAGVVLLLTYALAIGVNLARRRIDLDCGCAGPADRRPIAMWMVWRNLFLALLLGSTLLPWSERSLTGTDAVTIVGGLLAATFLYAALDRLLGQVMPRTAALRRGL